MTTTPRTDQLLTELGLFKETTAEHIVALTQRHVDFTRELEREVTHLTAELAASQLQENRLIAAAQAVIARWETPSWKDAPATAGYIYALRDAIPTPSNTDALREHEAKVLEEAAQVCEGERVEIVGPGDDAYNVEHQRVPEGTPLHGPVGHLAEEEDGHP